MMTLVKLICLSLLVTCLVTDADAQARRVRLRPRPVASEDQLQYYEADERAEDEDVVIVPQDEQQFIYTRPAARVDSYIRPAATPAPPRPRTKESAKAPPVQTIRNYNKVNDDGSFTFGYEAADGSFKEETRGTDCVVRGKYGYVDPDGNKREFTYVSGNPCDPNAQGLDEEDIDEKEESNETPNEPANYPVRPARPLSTPRPTTTVFQNNYRHASRPEVEEAIEEAPRTLPPRPAHAISITPRPTLPATTFRPQLLQITQRPQVVTPRPQVVYSSIAPSSIGTTPSPFASSPSVRPAGHIDFASEFAKFQQENQITPAPASFKTKAKTTEPISSTGNPIFSTQLVYDPSSGQYDSRLFQTLPQTNGDFTLNHRVQPSVTRPVLQQQNFRPSSQLYTAPQTYRSPQEVYQRQQAELQYQSSQQLYAQQQQLQQSQLVADRQAARAALAQASQRPPQYYYVAPGRDNQSPIDAFLRGHNIQF